MTYAGPWIQEDPYFTKMLTDQRAAQDQRNNEPSFGQAVTGPINGGSPQTTAAQGFSVNGGGGGAINSMQVTGGLTSGGENWSGTTSFTVMRLVGITIQGPISPLAPGAVGRELFPGDEGELIGDPWVAFGPPTLGTLEYLKAVNTTALGHGLLGSPQWATSMPDCTSYLRYGTSIAALGFSVTDNGVPAPVGGGGFSFHRLSTAPPNGAIVQAGSPITAAHVAAATSVVLSVSTAGTAQIDTDANLIAGSDKTTITPFPAAYRDAVITLPHGTTELVVSFGLDVMETGTRPFTIEPHQQGGQFRTQTMRAGADQFVDSGTATMAFDVWSYWRPPVYRDLFASRPVTPPLRQVARGDGLSAGGAIKAVGDMGSVQRSARTTGLR